MLCFGSTVATCSFNDGSITVTPITGTPGYTYLWSPAPGSGDGTANGHKCLQGSIRSRLQIPIVAILLLLSPLNNSGGPTGENCFHY